MSNCIGAPFSQKSFLTVNIKAGLRIDIIPDVLHAGYFSGAEYVLSTEY